MDNEDLEISEENREENPALAFFMDPKACWPEANDWKDWPLSQKALKLCYKHHHKNPASRL